MSAVIAWMAAEGERPVEADIPFFDCASPDGEATLREGSCCKERDQGGETADSSQESVDIASFPPNENRPSTSLRAGSGWGSTQNESSPPFENREGWASQPEQLRDIEQERRTYRRRTVAMLRRYMRYSIETGRLPSLLGREWFRAKVTSYSVVTFEDRVIFVHDMEMCLERLDEFSRQIIARHILQEHDCSATARLLHCGERTVRRLTPLVLDELSEILLEAGLMERIGPVGKKSCQGGLEGQISVCHCEDGENKRDCAFHARISVQSFHAEMAVVSNCIRGA